MWGYKQLKDDILALGERLSKVENTIRIINNERNCEKGEHVWIQDFERLSERSFNQDPTKPYIRCKYCCRRHEELQKKGEI